MRLPEFRPVILGSDLGVYSLARAFHEAYGVRSIVVSNSPRGPILHSRILQPRFAGHGASPEQTVALLERIGTEHPGVRLLLIPSAEHELDLIGEYWYRLSARFDLCCPAPEVSERARDKRVLDQVCSELGLPVPRSVHLDLTDHIESAPSPELDLAYPVVLKPANSGVHSQLSFPGKRKVYLASDAAQVRSVLDALVGGGYRDAMVAQELVPGDDTWGRTVTCYVNREGRITLMASGVLLLGMHSPTMIGNSVAVLTTPQPELAEQAEQICTRLGVRGFVNFDLKVDGRDGQARFFDLNTRVGRPNHYLLVAGVNPAVALVQDVFEVPEPDHQVGRRVGVYSYVPSWWLRRYLREQSLRRAVRRAWRRTRPGPHPLVYARDRHPRRWAYRMVSTVNLLRSYWRFYRRPTETGI